MRVLALAAAVAIGGPFCPDVNLINVEVKIPAPQEPERRCMAWEYTTDENGQTKTTCTRWE